MICRIRSLMVLLMILSQPALSQTVSKSQVLRKSYHSELAGKEREYWLYLPPGHRDNPGQQWPVLLFLHGSGERGDSLELVLKHGPIKEVVREGQDLPFIIIAPQLPNSDSDPQGRTPRPPSATPPPRKPMVRETTGREPRWGRSGPGYGWHSMEQELLAMVRRSLQEDRGDPDRVYITGLSMGGFGTWHMIVTHPDIWAAAVPICGSYDPDKVSSIGKLPVWVFQGGRDNTVLPEWTLATADALDAVGGDVRVTVHEDRGHDCWTRVYAGEDFYRWLLLHRRGVPGTAP